MDKDIIVHVMAEAIVNTIFDAWHHRGHIEVEHSDSFSFKLDGETYRVSLDKVDTP